MIPEKTPLVLRCVTIALAVIAFSTGSAGHLKACSFGERHYNSHHQINFVITMGFIVFVTMLVRVVLFDYKKRRLPSMKVQVAIDAIFVFLTFVAAIAAALSPVANDVCTGDNDMRTFIQEVCEFNCSDIVASIVMTFLMFVCFLIQILFTTNILRVGNGGDSAESYDFGESVGTPRAAKINRMGAANPAIGQV